MRSIVFIISLLAAKNIFSQEENTKANFHLGINAAGGIVTYYGTLNKRIIPFSSNNSPSYRFGVFAEYKSFVIHLNYGFVQYGQNKINYLQPLNFISKGKMPEIEAEYRFLKENENRRINLSAGSGIGFMSYALFRDLLNANEKVYHYWSDGSVRDLPESYENIFLSRPLARDYRFETPDGKYQSILLKISSAISFRITSSIRAELSTSFFIPFNRYIDHVPVNPSRSCLLFNSVAFSYRFSKAQNENDSPQYSGIDFKKMEREDTDRDGVKDFFDECPGTPVGVKVDSKGCPPDSDNDGIADYLDKEPHSRKGLLTDENGMGHEPSKEKEEINQTD